MNGKQATAKDTKFTQTTHATDLTFITNEGGQSLRDRFSVLLGKNTKSFDCLVGYFFISGFHQLHHSLVETEKIRILIGLKTDEKTYQLLEKANPQGQLPFHSHAEARERIPKEILKELEASPDSDEIETGIQRFIEWCQKGKLEIKVYPSRDIHAKVYIFSFRDGQVDKGRIITGSSNLSQSGLVENLEFNVELKNRSDYEFALKKFDDLWAEAVNVTEDYVSTITKKSHYAEFTPYELYLKFLYEYFRAELSQPETTPFSYLPDGFKKLQYQSDAVTAAKRIVDEYGGVFISDVVGLGKTYMAAMLVQSLEGRTLVIAPPALIDINNPGSWRNVFLDFRLPQAEFVSVGKLDDALRNAHKFENIVIDESHRFRTETNETYEKLALICKGKKVILVSATPLNNAPSDILSQIKLFQNGKNSTIPNVKNLEAFFTKLEKRLKGLDRRSDREQYLETVAANAKEIREKILKYLMIRRTRSEIANYYKEDLASQNLRFPEVADPTPLYYQLNQQENEIFHRTLARLTSEFKFTRYQPLRYFAGELNDTARVGEQNLMRFMRILLVKRLESSFEAFRRTISRFVCSYEKFIDTFKSGFVYTSDRLGHRVYDLIEEDDLDALERLIAKNEVLRFKAEDFDGSFIRHLEADLQTLKSIEADWKTIHRDPKWERLVELLRTDADLADRKLIIFSESKETAIGLMLLLETELGEKVTVYCGGSSVNTREQVIANFDPRSARKADDIRILVATDTLSEGVSLHRTNVIINYDIPWNPTRLIQRVGRVNRVDTQFDTIRTFNFFPTEQGNDVIKLKEAAEAKIQAFIEMLGNDARLLTEGEEVKSHDLFQKLVSRRTLTGEDTEQVSELEYLKVIRSIQDKDPELFEKIKRLPRKARAARVGAGNGPNLLTYFRRGRLEKFFLAEGIESRELDFLESMSILECPPETPKAKVGKPFYPLLDQNKQAFVDATQDDGGISELHPNSRRDTAGKLLRILKSRPVKGYQGFTDDDDDFLTQVVKTLEDGAIPRTTVKRIFGLVEQILEPIAILSVLKQEVSTQLFLQSPTRANRSVEHPREVILSAYIAPSNS